MLKVHAAVQMTGSFSPTKRLSADDWRISALCPVCYHPHRFSLLGDVAITRMYGCPNTPTKVPVVLQFSERQQRLIAKYRRRADIERRATEQPKPTAAVLAEAQHHDALLRAWEHAVGPHAATVRNELRRRRRRVSNGRQQAGGK